MALLDEIEPPSQDRITEKIKSLNNSTKTKNQFYNYFNQFRTRSFDSTFSRLIVLKGAGSRGFQSVRNFILDNKYLPHGALVSLGALVVLSNFNERINAEAYYKDFVSTGPDVEYSVASSVDKYTIPNGSELVKKNILASNMQEGFVDNATSFTTELTTRETPLPDNSSQSVDYVIKSGDTLTGLGWKFGVKLSTLKYVNNLDNVDTIKPGSKIKIPQKGYEVPQSQIAKREAENKAKLAAASRNTVTRDSASSRAKAAGPAGKVRTNPGSSNNGYPYGYCTYYVASRRYVPSNWGDAKRWLDSASRAGYQTGSEPTPGAIIVTRESWWGHVAYVESVDGDTITISEMNARGWGVISRRTMSAHDGVVRGYIY